MTRIVQLTPQLLESAYRMGVFPMGDPQTGQIDWYQPDPRAIFDLENFHVPRRLQKTLRAAPFQFTVNHAFDRVIRQCARNHTPDEVWITSPIIALYEALHQAGKAHSVEVWQNNTLVGGLYGVALGGAFMGESMFHTARDASKAALVFLVQRLRQRGFTLLDTQFPTPHLAQFGILMISHRQYMRRLRAALALQSARFDDPPPA